jgi:ferredoxin
VITVRFLTSGRQAEVAESTSLLRISIRGKGGIPFKCGGGVCGTCKCRIEEGQDRTDAVKPGERRHLTEADLAEGWRMACQTFVTGDVAVSWLVVKKQAGPAA